MAPNAHIKIVEDPLADAVLEVVVAEFVDSFIRPSHEYRRLDKSRVEIVGILCSSD